MKRTTVVLPDNLYVLLDGERRRRDVSMASVVREAIEVYLLAPRPEKYGFIALGEGDGSFPDAADEEGWDRIRAESLMAEYLGFRKVKAVDSADAVADDRS